MFFFKHKFSNWLRDVYETGIKNKSRSSVRRSLSRSSCSRHSNQTAQQEKALQERLRVAEFIGETKLLEKEKVAKYQGEIFRVQAELATAQARMRCSTRLRNNKLKCHRKWCHLSIKHQLVNFIVLGLGGCCKILLNYQYYPVIKFSWAIKCPQYSHYFNKLHMMPHLIIKVEGVTIPS